VAQKKSFFSTKPTVSLFSFPYDLSICIIGGILLRGVLPWQAKGSMMKRVNLGRSVPSHMHSGQGGL
jgi:hypothetical protein